MLHLKRLYLEHNFSYLGHDQIFSPVLLDTYSLVAYVLTDPAYNPDMTRGHCHALCMIKNTNVTKQKLTNMITSTL